jgi:[ribosomal protein S5]-alanine N-acetyltransferase
MYFMRLRAFDYKHDLPDLIDLLQDPRVVRFLRSPLLPNFSSQRYWKKVLQRQKRDSFGVVQVIETSQRSCAGFVTVLPSSQQDVYELMYWLGVAFWGRGWATEAVAQSVRVLRNQGYRGRVAADVAFINAASRRVLEKNGFVLAAVESGVPLCSGELSLASQYILNKNG